MFHKRTSESSPALAIVNNCQLFGALIYQSICGVPNRVPAVTDLKCKMKLGSIKQLN